MYGLIENIPQVVSINDSTVKLLFNILLFGTISSFTHCIGMCGAIAMGQSAIRMIESQNSSTLSKVMSSISWEYYIGKAIAYMILTFIVMKVGRLIDNNSTFAYIKFLLLSLVILYLTLSGIKVIYKLFDRNIPQIRFIKVFYHVPNIKCSFINSKVLSRLVIGICLGFIPCGVVYSAVGIIVSSTKSTTVALFAAFLFGLTTFPGLFILSYTGNVFFHRYGKLFNVIYLFSVILNIKFLIDVM